MKFIKVRKVKSPERGNRNDSWIDFFLPEEAWSLNIKAGDNIKIPLGVKIELPQGYDLTLTNKSGIASSTWLVTWACLVDNWYRGELVLNLINTSSNDVELKQEQKIVQGVIRRVDYMSPEEVEAFDTGITSRWEGWFGSTWI